MHLTEFLTRFKNRLMEPLLIEVSCNLNQNAIQWQQISSISLEIGYRGIHGKTIWKHIGWLQNQIPPSGRNFTHALWKSTMTTHVLVFDFIPVPKAGSLHTEKAYRLRKKIIAQNGQSRTTRSGNLIGDYSDEHFTLHPIYPSIED